jgi:beta-catenin-like protein 1
MTDVILAWLIAEDDGAKRRIVKGLADRDEDLSVIRATLQGMPILRGRSGKPILTLIPEQLESASEEEPSEDQRLTKDMLNALLQFI